MMNLSLLFTCGKTVKTQIAPLHAIRFMSEGIFASFWSRRIVSLLMSKYPYSQLSLKPVLILNTNYASLYYIISYMISFYRILLISYSQLFYKANMFDMKNQKLLELNHYMTNTHYLKVILKMIFKI